MEGGEEEKEAQQTKKYKSERAVYHSNKAACHIKLEEYQQAIEASNAALDLDPSFTRALQRRAQAGELQATFASMSQAKQDHERVVETLKIELGLIQPKKEEPEPAQEQEEEEEQKVAEGADRSSASTSLSAESSASSGSPKTTVEISSQNRQDDIREGRRAEYKPVKLDLDEAGKKKHRMMIQTSEQALRRMEPRLKELMEKEKAEMLGMCRFFCFSHARMVLFVS